MDMGGGEGGLATNILIASSPDPTLALVESGDKTKVLHDNNLQTLREMCNYSTPRD